MDYTVAITGGIGSGKSVVCAIVRKFGFQVYDCDSRAKALMNRDSALQTELVEAFGNSVISAEGINRKHLADMVFNDNTLLEILNNIVHGRVIADFKNWQLLHPGLKFVETAILYQSGIDKLVNEVWIVDAPSELRCRRAATRDKANTEDIVKRIKSQDNFNPTRRHPLEHTLINDGMQAILPQIQEYLRLIYAKL